MPAQLRSDCAHAQSDLSRTGAYDTKVQFRALSKEASYILRVKKITKITKVHLMLPNIPDVC